MKKIEIINQKLIGKKDLKWNNLERTRKCIEIFDIKLQSKIIHVTGTNGKGSTVNYLRTIFNLNNDSVTTFVSPYVIELNERITFNDNNISDSDFIEIAEYILSTLEFEVSYFEYLFLIYLIYSKKMKPKYMIIEVGIGGLLDCTNVVKTDLQILTNVSLDHMKILGETKEKILNQKLGIVDNYLITSELDLKDNIVKYIDENNYQVKFIQDIRKISSNIFEYDNEIYELSLKGDYQFSNASLALEAIKYLDGTIDGDIVKSALKQAYFPGRYELLGNFTIDGAHNAGAIKNILNNYDKRDCLIFTQMKDKYSLEINKMIKSAKFKKIYIYLLEDNHRAIDKEFLNNYDFDYEVITSIKGLDIKRDYLCFGSLYLASNILHSLKK